MTDSFYALLASAILLWVLYILASRRVNMPAAQACLPLIGLWFLFVVSSFWSIAPDRTIYQATGLLAFVWLSYLVAGSANKVQPSSWVYITTGLSVLVAVLFVSTALRYGSVRIVSQEMREAIGTFSNVGGAVVILTLPYSVFSANGRGKRALLGKLGLVAALAAVLLSGSRAAYALGGLVMVMSVIAFSENLRRAARWIIFAPIGLVAALFVAAQFVDLGIVQARLVERFAGSVFMGGGAGLSDATDVERARMLDEAASIITSHPLLGIGYEGFAKWFEAAYGYLLPSHNLFVTALAEAGILGLMACLWLIVASAGRVVRAVRFSERNSASRRFAIATGIALFGALAHSMVRPQLSNPMFFFVLGLALSYRAPSSGLCGTRRLSTFR
ncbi:O-antigen ligase family protein [Thiohalocapsa halophila]|uniref:O-antigen ligase family protein n=1 Tax=Thiohalocapsa halophila TaxID=69359 RepID=UPI001906F49D|nr:O-antigen ligase family protein [Thiohalocapsa halophila]